MRALFLVLGLMGVTNGDPSRTRALPSLERVQQAAIRHAQLDPARARRWLRAARRAAVLPDVDLTWEHRYDRGWTHDLEPGVPDELQSDHDAADMWRVKVSWELDRLWFNPDELRAARASADLARWRHELIAEITKLYFELQRSREDAQAPELPSDERRAARERARELEGLLSGLSGLSL
jgi:outer membrane protein TolC